MRNIFKPEDFEEHGIHHSWSSLVAKISNEKLNKLIDSCQIVGWADDDCFRRWIETSAERASAYSKLARLVLMEEVGPKKCDHEIVPLDPVKINHGTHVCKKCCKQFSQKWIECKD